jgi:deazaflavin-dependent oxidoreductase (nitroreductase family)
MKMPEQRIADGLPDWIQDHLQRYMNSDGADGHYWDAAGAGGEGLFPTLLLTTTGRKSGDSSTIPLIYGKTDRGYCVIASKGGAPAHPAWYLNLDADPDVHVQVAADKFSATPRVAEGEEREALWAQMVGIYAPYTDYQAATERKIPVVVLEPVQT